MLRNGWQTACQALKRRENARANGTTGGLAE
jgi:hypothetical protein